MNSRKDKADAADFITALRKLSENARAFIFKGFPPTPDQAKARPIADVVPDKEQNQQTLR